jgi:sirohydrochlorin ferrochelatase
MSQATALLLVDHGSTREEANDLLRRVAELVAARGSVAIVRYAHMEIARPTIAEAFADCVAAGAAEVVVHPYFLGPGKHTTFDIPRLVREAAASHPGVVWRITEPLGLHPNIGDIVLERMAEARRRG